LLKSGLLDGVAIDERGDSLIDGHIIEGLRQEIEGLSS